MSEVKIGGPRSNGHNTPPVYVRLQNRAQAASGRHMRSPEQAKLRSISLAFLVLVCVSCALWLLAGYVGTDSRFQLHEIELRDGHYVSRAAVENIFAPDRDVSIYDIPLEQRRHELEQIPWVHAATVTRILPDRVVITVEERQPVAFLWTRHGIELIDRDGVILETPPDVSWTFPVLRGVPERQPVARRKVQMARYLKLMEGLRLENGGYPAEISEVDLSDPADVSVVVTGSSKALRLHLGDEAFRERYDIYRSHIDEWRQQFSEIHSVDLRYKGQAVIQSASPFTVSVDQKSSSRTAPASGASLPPQDQPGTPVASTRSSL